MGYPSGLEVRVCQRGQDFAWELWHPGNPVAWKFSGPLYKSDAAARNAGLTALTTILTRSEKRQRSRKIST
jgi:hypothetical protein